MSRASRRTLPCSRKVNREPFMVVRAPAEKAADVSITVDGQDLKDFLSDELGKEVRAVRIDIITTISKSVATRPLTKKSGTGSGRGPGKPPRGLKRGRSLSREEIAECQERLNRTKPPV